jgi:exodeoxyribonuclease VII large subunit
VNESLPWGGSVPSPAQAPLSGPKAWSVSQLTEHIRSCLETQELKDVWVKGEVSGFRPAASGHWYFSLKDPSSLIAMVAFRGSKRGVALHDGLEVIVHGKIGLYPPRGSYQLVVDEVLPVGAGAEQARLQLLREKLQKEGLFDPARKKPLPRRPQKLVVVTSDKGAALTDVLSVLARRAPHIHVTVVPSLVQGEGAAPSMIRAIKYADESRLGDLILLTRGGGSQEDLGCFNDELLVRCIAACQTPLISAVGHEIDTSLSDWVADYRAPTPSAAAEILSEGWLQVLDWLQTKTSIMHQMMLQGLRERRLHVQVLSKGLRSPSEKLAEQRQRLDELVFRLEPFMQQRLMSERAKWEAACLKLEALSPLAVLARGYTLVLDQPSGLPVSSGKNLALGQRLGLQFHDGAVEVEVCAV